MKKIYTMTNLVKGLMLAAFMAVGTSAVNAQEGGAEGSGSESGAESTSFAPANEKTWLVAEELTANGQEVCIYNVGTGTYLSGKTPSVKSINDAYTWIVSGDVNTTCTFACTNSTADRIHMGYNNILRYWETEIKEKSGASSLTMVTNTTDKSYKMSVTTDVYTGLWSKKAETRYFTTTANGYEASTDASNNNDWLFISAAQKAAYADYTSLYNQAIELLDNENLADREDVKETLKSALKSTAASNYDKYTTDAATLKNAIDAANKAIEDITNGINNINDSAANGSAINTNAAAIYSINGVRNAQLTKGINIVKMSDGKVKKILVK